MEITQLLNLTDEICKALYQKSSRTFLQTINILANIKQNDKHNLFQHYNKALR